MKIVLLGAPGCGKGTQAEVLNDRLGIPTISTGNMLRAAIKAGTDLGKQVESVLARGELVSDDIILAILAERVAEPDCKAGYILDGVPRTVPQAEGMEQAGIEVEHCIFLDVSEEIIVKRLSGRRACNCGMTYHITNKAPQAENVCDKCGSGLMIRADDEPAAIQNRLAIYHSQTAPLVAFYKDRGKLHVIQGGIGIQAENDLIIAAMGL